MFFSPTSFNITNSVSAKTINSTLNSEASGTKKTKTNNKPKYRWRQDCALHMLIIYLSGSTD